MRVGLLVGIGAVAALLGTGTSAYAASAVQFDLAGVFNEDVIVNGTTLDNLDETQTSVDLIETSLITQGAAAILDNCTGDPHGLPDDGRFAANGDHPLVDLAYDNTDDGLNARRSPSADSYRIAVPHRRYRSIHVFATSGNGNAKVRLKLRYRGDSAVKKFSVPDWFEFAPTRRYPLIDEMDRATPDGSVCFDDDAAAIWGFEITTNPSRTLKSVTVIRPDGDGEAVLNVFGMTGLRPSS